MVAMTHYKAGATRLHRILLCLLPSQFTIAPLTSSSSTSFLHLFFIFPPLLLPIFPFISIMIVPSDFDVFPTKVEHAHPTHSIDPIPTVIPGVGQVFQELHATGQRTLWYSFSC